VSPGAKPPTSRRRAAKVTTAKDRDRLRKVEALRKGGATQGERDAAASAAARLSDTRTTGLAKATMESEVLAHLANLGYRLACNTERPPPGARCVESDDGFHRLVEHLRAVTSMANLPEPSDWFRRLVGSRHIVEPALHPSGHRTSEAPHTRVTALSAGTHTPGRKRP
jgi:hypothetical protein